MESCLALSLISLTILQNLQTRTSAVVLNNRTAVEFPNFVPKGKISDCEIDESSGLSVSRRHTGVMYTHNDKGGRNVLYAVEINSGKRLATLTINNVINFDWEDLAYGPCADDCRIGSCSTTSAPGRYCIYISETGDHSGDGAKNKIYMVREPAVIRDQDVDVVDTLKFSWSESDCETLMATPTGQLYVVSKVKNKKSKIAQIPVSAWDGGDRVALNMSQTKEIDLITTSKGPQGGDVSPGGTEMVLVFEMDVFYFYSADGDFLEVVSTQQPQRITNYKRVESTEAIAWSADGQGFYTIAEGKGQIIYFYGKASTYNVGSNTCFGMNVFMNVCLSTITTVATKLWFQA